MKNNVFVFCFKKDKFDAKNNFLLDFFLYMVQIMFFWTKIVFFMYTRFFQIFFILQNLLIS